MPGIAVLAGKRAFHRTVNVGIVKDNEGCIATQLQGEFLDRGRRLRQQDATHFGGAGEADVTHHIAGAKNLAHGNGVVGVSGDDVEHPSRYTGAQSQLGNGQRTQGRQFGRLDDHRATRRQRGRDLACDHGHRKVPRRDGGADANRLAQQQQAAVVVKLRQGLAVDAFGFFGKPLHKAGAIGDFAFGLGQRLALFGGHDAPQVILIRHDQVIPLAQNDAALLGGFVAPGRPGGVGSRNGLFGLSRSQVRDVREVRASGRVSDSETACAADPLAIDQGIGFQESGVFEQGKR